MNPDGQHEKKVTLIEGFRGSHWFLSNFSPSRIQHEGIWYPTVEHAYQANKTMSMHLRGVIARMKTPGEAKAAGWNLPATSPLRPDWNRVRVRVMRDLIKLKFAPFSDLSWDLVESTRRNSSRPTIGTTTSGATAGAVARNAGPRESISSVRISSSGGTISSTGR